MATAMDMSDTAKSMDTGNMVDMGDSQMSMTFFFSSTTSLFSKAWTPTNSAEYAGTCIFLVVLAVIMRFMLALKPVLEKSIWNAVVGSRGQLIPNDEAGYQKGDMATRPPLMRVYGDMRRRWAAWRFKTSLSRASFELSLATIGYLLMLAVMTMNVGYFLAVLGGLFLGTFIVGDLAADNSLYQDHHC
ncbi:Ctr copper transporter family-domain-containing protein [Annulohypoxylon maeteangense]|uniref:Ctr copper transporter family-domain-containing protein n=1 Tax=Annulohypoxylon maeteangense TaxID=1927788 RepID=UPI00200789DB|nr:Ctr copper transporter family-domain-containing protein [Annulohypoxylon maeteangense]KAI0888796.1 Ctr copper transporter family-domain-containing protein [Annulohypoxylon maeteangense]